MMMMMMSDFRLPPNGYYNPPKPRVTVKNYQEAVNYGDDAKYGGNSDGKVSQSELTNIKKTFDYAAGYYKNMYQQSGDAKYMAWSDHYNNSAIATDNMNKNTSIFMKADPAAANGITNKGVTSLATKDGNADEISERDLVLQQFANFKTDGLATAHYENVVKYGDDVKYGGNGDGQINEAELTNIKQTFDYAEGYYKNQAALATNPQDKEKFTAWSNYYGNDAKAAENIAGNKDSFSRKDIAYAQVGIVAQPFLANLQSIQNLAGKDGNAQTVSLQDLTKNASYSNSFVDNEPLPQYKVLPGLDQPQYTQPTNNQQYNQPVGNQQYTPPMGNQQYTQPTNNQQYVPTQQQQYNPLMGNQQYNQPVGNQQYNPLMGNQQYNQPVGNQQYTPPMGNQQYTPPMGNQQYNPPMGNQQYNPPMGNQQYNPPMGNQQYAMNNPFPATQDLTYLRAKAGNPQAWDGAAFAQGTVSRQSAVDVSRDGQISYAEAINSPDGLLGNGILRLPPDSPQTRALWDALSGPDGKVNPQELAAAILSVDGNGNGTITAQEANKFLQDTMAKLAQNPSGVISTYNNFQANASGFGLDNFLQNPEAAYALQMEQQINSQQQGQLQGSTLSLLQQAEQARLQLQQGYQRG